MSAAMIATRDDRAPNGSVAPYLAALRNDPCSYCDAPSATHDHIVPMLRRVRDPDRVLGRDGWSNLTGACTSCNSSKGSKSLLGFLGLRSWLAEYGCLLDERDAWRGVGI